MIINYVVVCFAIVLNGGLVAGDDETDDKDKIQGEWSLVSMETSGRKMDEEAIKKSKLEVKNNEWVSTANGRELTRTYKLDSSKSPKQIDLVSKQEDKKVTWLAIYKIDGDALTFCWPAPGAERPKELKIGDRIGVAVYKRVTKK